MLDEEIGAFLAFEFVGGAEFDVEDGCWFIAEVADPEVGEVAGEVFEFGWVDEGFVALADDGVVFVEGRDDEKVV